MKKSNKIKALAAVIALSIAVAVPVVLAQTAEEGQKREHRMGKRGHGKRGGDRMMGGRLFRQLDLTDAQKAQIKQIHESNRETLRPLREEMRAKRQEIRQARQGGTVDEALLKEKLTEMAAIQAKLMAERSRIHEETLSVLTPEQRAKHDQLREQFKTKKNERRTRQEQRTL